MARGQVLVVKNEEYIKAVKALGASNSRILFKHLLPNIVSSLIVYATLNVAGAILTEASLIRSASHIATYSGLAILITVLGFNLLGDGIRDVLDPKMKK